MKHKRNFTVVLMVIMAGIAILSCQPEELHQSQRKDKSPHINQQISSEQPDKEVPIGAPAISQTTDFKLLADRFHIKAIRDGELLNTAIGNFLNQTNENSLKLARQAWQRAHASLTTLWAVYQADPLWRQIQHPTPHSVYSLVDAAPLLPGYLDSVPGYPNSGLVAALDIPLDYASLAALHQHADTEFVVLGLHPLEYFLWTGVKPLLADSSEQSQDSNNIGQTLNKRRRKLIKLIAEAYQEQLVTMHTQWHQREYGQIYADSQSEAVPNYGHPVLVATMNYLDRFITRQLELNPDTNTYAFTDHAQFNADVSSFWRGINSAIIQLADLNQLTAPLITNQRTALLNCLLNLQPVPVTNPTANKPCQQELRDLKETIIVSYSQSDQ